MDWLRSDTRKHAVLAQARVVGVPGRCVQCGVCSFNCPMAIDVRRHVWLARSVADSHCLTCGECVKRCPRAVLRFETSADPTGRPGTRA